MGQRQELAKARVLYKTMLKSKDFVSHCEARLGDEEAIPTLEEVKDSKDSEVMDKCVHFFEFIVDNLNLVRSDIESREMQMEIPLGDDLSDREEQLKETLAGKDSANA